MPRKKKEEAGETEKEKAKEKEEKTEKEKIEEKKENEGKKEKEESEVKKEKQERREGSEEKIEEIVGGFEIEIGKKHKELLIALEKYVASGIHIGTRVIMPDMRKYVYRRRADGLAILNTNMIDEKLREACKVLADYAPEEIILVCKRECGWSNASLFSELTGIRCFTKKYPAGIITNPILQGFFEPSLVVICDPWLDKNALHDANLLRMPVLGLCDSNNLTRGINFVVPCNNKSGKSLGLIFFILAREYCKARGLKFEKKIEDFVVEEK